MSTYSLKLDKFNGCLYGGAVGDALGYPIEFRSAEDIFILYGKDGIQDYELFHGKALISDDTQMTLFTANGLLVGYACLYLRGDMGKWQNYIEAAYKDWMITQNEKCGQANPYCKSWLLNVEEMYRCRAPGITCLSALRDEKCGSVSSPVNESKGCGGIMRVAPVGLYLPKYIDNLIEVDQIGAEAAAITHGHPLGYIPAAALVHIVAKCAFSDDGLEEIIAEAIETTIAIYKHKPHIDEFKNIMKKAVFLAHQDLNDLDAIREIGEGWVAEERLAIAVYCSLKYQDNFTKAVTASVNHGGDSDSTGAVTGNIMGAYLGMSQIPNKFIEPLELKEVIFEIAADLCEECTANEYGNTGDNKWHLKYFAGEHPDYK